MLNGLEARIRWALLQVELVIDPETADCGDVYHHIISISVYSGENDDVPPLIAAVPELCKWYEEGVSLRCDFE